MQYWTYREKIKRLTTVEINFSIISKFRSVFTLSFGACSATALAQTEKSSETFLFLTRSSEKGMNIYLMCAFIPFIFKHHGTFILEFEE